MYTIRTADGRELARIHDTTGRRAWVIALLLARKWCAEFRREEAKTVTIRSLNRGN